MGRIRVRQSLEGHCPEVCQPISLPSKWANESCQGDLSSVAPHHYRSVVMISEVVHKGKFVFLSGTISNLYTLLLYCVCSWLLLLRHLRLNFNY